MALFSVTTFVLFHFGLDARSLEGDLAAGVFWVTMLFAAVLAINRQFVAEREEGGFDGFLLAPVDRTALFVAKAAVLFGFLVALQVVAVPAFAILLLEPSPGPGLPELAGMLLLADAGIAVVGHARRRARGPDPRARGDRAAARAAADDPRRDRRREGHGATLARGGRGGGRGPLAADPRAL